MRLADFGYSRVSLTRSLERVLAVSCRDVVPCRIFRVTHHSHHPPPSQQLVVLWAPSCSHVGDARIKCTWQ